MGADADLTRDAFLGGALHLWQPRRGYRAGIDPVLLAAAVPARAGDTVLDLGCGAGAASLCLLTRVPGVTATGLELQPAYAALARRNAGEAGLALEVMEGDVRAPPPALRALQFDHVIANPPYYRRGGAAAAPDAGRETALAGPVPLADWIDAGVRRLRPGGQLTIIQRADRVPDLLAVCGARLGRLRLLPVAPRAGRPAELAILHGRKGARTPFRLLAPLVLHAGAQHRRDGDDYLPEIAAILRRGAPLPVDWS